MDLNWCPVCEQHIPLAWEASLYCSDRCKKADAMATHPTLGYAYPADLQTFPRAKTAASSPLSSPTLTSFNSSSAVYPSPPTSPSTNYLYHKTTSGRISPPAFSLGHPATTTTISNQNYLDLRRKSSTGPQYSTNISTTTSNSKKGGYFW
ncbi:hypothetical protein EMPS_06679 [Entomortierella parvispora]|uniref:Uncharacterized protein n=1 Tax=Entomortierella parvispora TaxID=205924 RepID=A0A9P3LXG5_9FUNG|nr:hypothetical protein EMPS_06679 [Entomortierella parvispora]